jgi:serine/threonine protein kinase
VEISDSCRDLIEKMLVKNPKLRLSAAECLRHPWFQEQPQEHLSEPKLNIVLDRIKSFHITKRLQLDALEFLGN